MKVPMSWLNEFTDVKDIPMKEYMHELTMSGSKVEGCDTVCGGISNVVIGKIEKIEAHPDADKLRVCQVKVGEETVQIVTGAPNVQEGDVVPVALAGSTLAGGVKIKKGKLRGVESNGMLCSDEELGVNINDEKATGIWILDPSLPIGEDAVKALGLKEDVVEFEITSNRPDCLSIIGLARETAATFKRPFAVKESVYHENGEDIDDYLSVCVEDNQKCYRYAAKVVKNVKIEPSPEWMQRRLNRAGVRAINNIVDITNYVMLEYGQPMHAFDISYIEGNEINVRCAKDGEKIMTLDGIERELNANMLVICDKEKPNAIAGVMGGENSGVTEDTKTIVFESANFLGSSVRKTAVSLGMRTESSARYEKGLDPNMVLPALNRALELVEQLGAGEIVGGIIDIQKIEKQPVTLPLEADKINRFLGTEIPEADMIKILESLTFKVENGMVTAPSFRIDIGCMNDIAEEVARIYGYNNIKSTMLQGDTLQGGFTKEQSFENRIKTLLADKGFYEIYAYSFTNPKLFDLLRIDAESPLRKVVTISNPLGEENSIMRTTSIHSMLEVLQRNYSHRNKEAFLFECANVYLPKSLSVTELPEERKKVTLGCYGNTDFFALKGMVQALLDDLGIDKVSYVPVQDNKTFHPYRTAHILNENGDTIGVIGEIHPLVCKNYEIDEKVYLCELDLNTLYDSVNRTLKYEHLPKFPATTRDMAMLVDDEVMVSQIEAVIVKKAGKILEHFSLFDVYKGSQIPEGKKSIAYSLSFRAADRTLNDEEVNASMDKILKGLKEEVGADLR